ADPGPQPPVRRGGAEPRRRRHHPPAEGRPRPGGYAGAGPYRGGRRLCRVHGGAGVDVRAFLPWRLILAPGSGIKRASLREPPYIFRVLAAGWRGEPVGASRPTGL